MSKNQLVVDIETVPLAASLAVPFDAASIEYPANYKSDEAKAKYAANAEATHQTSLIKKASLNPRIGRVLCIGLKREDEETIVLTAPTEADEVSILRRFWEIVDSFSFGPRMTTWNGQFDLRFLVIRSLAHGLEAPVSTREWFKKYNHASHLDCKAALLNYDVIQKGEGLDEWAAFFGLQGKPEGMDGSKVYPMYCEGRLAEIADYCRADVDATAAIADRIVPFYL